MMYNDDMFYMTIIIVAFFVMMSISVFGNNLQEKCIEVRGDWNQSTKSCTFPNKTKQ